MINLRMKVTTKIYLVATFATLLISSSFLQGQTLIQANNSDNSFLSNSKPQLSVSLSSSFTSFGPGFNAFGTSIMPQVTFPVSEKLSLTGGVGYSTFFMGNGSDNVFNSNQSNYGHVFVSGNYLVNEKITLRGTAYKTFMLSPPAFGSETTYPGYDFSSQGVIMDVEYKVTDNFRINIGFEYRQQNYPMYSPGMNPINPIINNASPFTNFNRHNSFNSF